MRLEVLPLIFGIAVLLGGLALLLDAYLPDSPKRLDERRRRARAERDRRGEVFIGVGLLAIGAALLGRDVGRFGTVFVLVGVLSLAIGIFANRTYLREALTFRGAARRGRSPDRLQGPRDDA